MVKLTINQLAKQRRIAKINAKKTLMKKVLHKKSFSMKEFSTKSAIFAACRAHAQCAHA